MFLETFYHYFYCHLAILNLNPLLSMNGTSECDEHPATDHVILRKITWRNEILSGLNQLQMRGISGGKMVAFGENSEPILTIGPPDETLIAAAEYGQGRVVVYAHRRLTLDFYYNSKINRNLTNNVVKWITRGRVLERKDVRVIRFNQQVNVTNLGTNDGNVSTILLWDNQNFGSPASIRELKRYVRNGGGLVCGLKPGYKNVGDRRISKFLKHFGIGHLPFKISLPATLDISTNMAAEAHFEYMMHSSNHSQQLLEIHGKHLHNTMKYLPTDIKANYKERILSMIRRYDDDVHFVPTNERPVTTETGKILLGLYDTLLWDGLTDDPIAPGCDVFPGIIPVNESVNVVNKSITIQSNLSDFYFTGLYLPAGSELTVNAKDHSGAELYHWKISIGIHHDKLDPEEKDLRRWPKVSTRHDLQAEEMKIKHPFGGLVYLKSPYMKHGSLQIDIQNVIETPVFDLRKNDSEELWNQTRHSKGLWAEISGHYITFVLPVASVQMLEANNLTDVMLFWDRVVESMFELKGVTLLQKRRQVVVTDEQPVIGVLHSGYPIVARLDRAESSQNNEVSRFLNLETLNRKGHWGAFHEIGHNLQDRIWSFKVGKEVTNNIFVLYALDRVVGRSPWRWFLELSPGKKRSISRFFRKNKIDWNHGKAFTKLTIFVQIARDFGWTIYAKMFREFNNLNSAEIPKTEQDKVDMWMVKLSEATQHNLIPLFRFWGFEISDDIPAKTSNLTAYLPDDEITREYGPGQTAIILDEFQDIIRHPANVPDYPEIRLRT